MNKQITLKDFDIDDENKKVSKELGSMITSGIGFRYEEYNHITYKNPEDVIKFEIFDLGNEDIIDFVESYYDIKYPSDKLIDRYNTIIDFIKENLNESNINNIEVIWLASTDIAATYYGDMNENNIKKFKFNDTDNIMVISDLGYEGHLFAYKKGSITEDDN
jgi:hypothetical protein